ncbi:DMT family transporter [Thalassovita mediterranea]|jgi:drug/metabolite transporter (DMT)-like permease|uniref:Carboxylate/amino acid/amine transporter n=1 Tax=Thalassovita mediterranea TaxID=340021 RepID=A0A0P1GQM5_9RHOB|nr:DMT family transporter [Thalassovita mediterranea]CUH84854.1 carboxylate/amino acid/amine transporter [Thalassovita mediterranea]SIS29196.1 Permease of the drug/metabolite transporter (DMT) superfamily [Thalassovita mediterranea]
MSQHNKAILLMIAAVFCFTVMDATAKELSRHLGIMQAIWARYAGQALMVLVIVLPRIQTVARTRYPGWQLVRSVILLGATGSFFTGISYIDLAEATAIMNVNPVLITLGAALFLGEGLGPRRAIGIGVALIGALIIIRPGSGVFTAYALFPLMAACCYSCYNLVTRYVGANEDAWTSLLYTAAFGAVILSVIVPFHWQPVDGHAIVLMAVLAAVGTLAQWLLIKSLTMGEAGMLAPFAYVSLIFATLWGVLFFDEYPDQWTIVGALVIVAAGIYVWHRETAQNRASERDKARASQGS